MVATAPVLIVDLLALATFPDDHETEEISRAANRNEDVLYADNDETDISEQHILQDLF